MVVKLFLEMSKKLEICLFKFSDFKKNYKEKINAKKLVKTYEPFVLG
jgi:hypothetical protein